MKQAQPAFYGVQAYFERRIIMSGVPPDMRNDKMDHQQMQDVGANGMLPKKSTPNESYLQFFFFFAQPASLLKLV